MNSNRREALADCPPSAKLVYKALEWEGRQTQQQLAEETLLSPRTVRSALRTLEDADIVTEGIHFRDARKNVYEIRTEPKGRLEEEQTA